MGVGKLTVQDWGAYHTPHELRVEFSDADPNRRQRDPLLDSPSEPHPFLNAVMDLALLRLTVVANGATQAWGPDAGMRKGSGSDSVILSDPDAWTVDQLAWDYYYGATTHRARLRVILEAQTLARRWSTSDPSLVKGTEAWKARLAADGRPYRALAHEYGVSIATISRLKRGTVAV